MLLKNACAEKMAENVTVGRPRFKHVSSARRGERRPHGRHTSERPIGGGASQAGAAARTQASLSGTHWLLGVQVERRGCAARYAGQITRATVFKGAESCGVRAPESAGASRPSPRSHLHVHSTRGKAQRGDQGLRRCCHPLSSFRTHCSSSLSCTGLRQRSQARRSAGRRGCRGRKRKLPARRAALHQRVCRRLQGVRSRAGDGALHAPASQGCSHSMPLHKLAVAVGPAGSAGRPGRDGRGAHFLAGCVPGHRMEGAPVATAATCVSSMPLDARRRKACPCARAGALPGAQAWRARGLAGEHLRRRRRG